MKEKVGLEDEGEGRAVNTLTVVTCSKLRLFRGYSKSQLYRWSVHDDAANDNRDCEDGGSDGDVINVTMLIFYVNRGNLKVCGDEDEDGCGYGGRNDNKNESDNRHMKQLAKEAGQERFKTKGRAKR